MSALEEAKHLQRMCIMNGHKVGRGEEGGRNKAKILETVMKVKGEVCNLI